jgi:hypothetical protein
VNLRAIFPKYRIMYDGGTYTPYYIQRRYPFGWKWYFHEGYFPSPVEAIKHLKNKLTVKRDRVVGYV